MTKSRGPLDDELILIVYEPDGAALWSGQVKAVPRIGEDIMITDLSDNTWQTGGTVAKVIWMLRDKVAGQRVAIYLDEIVRRQTS